MSENRGKQWTWQSWRGNLEKSWIKKQGLASMITGIVFLMLLVYAIGLKQLAPWPMELEENPLVRAKREVAAELLKQLYWPDCEESALSEIKEPFRSFAKKTGWFAPEAFQKGLSCIDKHLKENGLASLDTQIRANKKMEALLDLNCVGDLRSSSVCEKAFIYSKNRAQQVSINLIIELKEKEKHQ